MTSSAGAGREVPQSHRVILVRHAHSRVDPQRAPREWGLTAEGHAAAGRLGALALLDHATGFYAGPEPKMIDTLVPAATARRQAVQPESGLAETASEGWFGEAEFRETVRRFFASPETPSAPGWEAGLVAVARCGAAIERLREGHPVVVHPGHVLPGTFVVASGGRLLTAYLASLLGWNGAGAFERWQALRMPDLAVLELAPEREARLVIPFGTLVV